MDYTIAFDNDRYGNMRIDYEALSAHLVTLHKSAGMRGHDLWGVIFTPELQGNFYDTKYDDYRRRNIIFLKALLGKA